MRVLVCFFLICYSFIGYSNSRIDVFKYSVENNVIQKRSINQEELFESELLNYNEAKSRKDTLTIIQSLINLSDFDRYRGDYDLAFDKLWESLELSQVKGSESTLVLIYRNLGILYDIFNKDTIALEYLLKSVDLSKKQPRTDNENLRQFVSSYFSVAMYYRNREEYDIALKYLDSCDGVFNKKEKLPYILADRGYCYLKLNKLRVAENYLFEAKKILKDENSPYQVAVYSFIGDLKVNTAEKDSALVYFNKSLDAIEKLKVHMELKPKILEKMADVNFSLGNSDKAYEYMKASQKSFDALFSAANRNNERLFEIKNKYKENITKKEQFITKQNDLLAKKKQEQIFLFLVFGFIAIASGGIYIVSRQRNKIKQSDLIQQLETKKNTEVLDTKNKELTSYSLQLVEKEQAIDKLLEVIQNEVPNKHTSLSKKFTTKNNTFWDDFNRRFIEINSGFYQELNNKHNNLTSTELKHCALIKLNLDSQEMSYLLNISLQSVHTSRYRIKKKIGIGKNESLETYIREL